MISSGISMMISCERILSSEAKSLYFAYLLGSLGLGLGLRRLRGQLSGQSDQSFSWQIALKSGHGICVKVRRTVLANTCTSKVESNLEFVVMP